MQVIQNAVAHEISFNEGVLRLAAVHGREVKFRYAKSDTAPIEFRSFVPQHVSESTEGNIVVVGPDSDRDSIRSYRLDRIKGEVGFA